MGTRTLGASPWRRAVRRGITSPAVLASGLLATLVLTVAASSAPLFLASASTAALHNEARQVCPEAAQPAITDDRGPRSYPSSEQAPDAARAAIPRVAAAMTSEGLPAPAVVGLTQVELAGSDVTLYSRADALAHVRRVAGGGAGLWLPQSFAAQAKLAPGATVRVGSASTRVAGIYRDLAPSAFVPLFRLPRYWCTWSELIVPTIFNQPPPFAIVDQATLLALAHAAAGTVDLTWYAPLPVDRQTLPQARSGLSAMQRAFATLPAATLYRQAGDLPYLLVKAQRERDGLRGPVVPVAIAGLAVALALVGACGAFWSLRRKREVTLLHVRGVGRAGIAAKAALELLPGAVAGTTAGWLAGVAVVEALGPSSRLEPGAIARALEYAIAAGALGLLVAAVVAAKGVPADAPPRGRRWVRLPWELALGAAAVATYASVRHNGAVHVVKATVQIDPMVLAFPLLALVAALAVLTRAGRLALLHSARPAQRLPVPAYLAARRLAGTPLVALGTLSGVALPLAVLLYSSALSGSTTDDVAAKYRTNVGADHAFGTVGSHGNPATGGFGTVVSRIQTDPQVDGQPVTVLGIDPGTFTRFAAGGRDVAAVTQRLTGDAAVLVNAPAGFTATSVQVRDVRVPVHVVARRASFPGLRNPYLPMLVVDRAALPPLSQLVDRTEEVWTTDRDFTAAVTAVRAAHIDISYEVTTDTFLDNTGLRPVTWIFGYLQALAVLTGLVAFAGVTAAFTARTRRRALAYHLSRRMGLTRGAHRISLGAELGVLLAASWVAGAGLGVGAVALVYRLTDPYPAFPPPPALPVPVAGLLASAAAALALGAVGAAALQRLLDRTPVPLRT